MSDFQHSEAQGTSVVNKDFKCIFVDMGRLMLPLDLR